MGGTAKSSPHSSLCVQPWVGVCTWLRTKLGVSHCLSVLFILFPWAQDISPVTKCNPQRPGKRCCLLPGHAASPKGATSVGAAATSVEAFTSNCRKLCPANATPPNATTTATHTGAVPAWHSWAAILGRWALWNGEDAADWSNGGGAISFQVWECCCGEKCEALHPQFLRLVGGRWVPPNCWRGAHREVPRHCGYPGPSGSFFRSAWRPHTTNHVKQRKPRSFGNGRPPVFCWNAPPQHWRIATMLCQILSQCIRPCSTVNEKVHGPFGSQEGPNLFSEEPRYAWGIWWRMPTLWKVTCQNHIAKL